MKLGIVGISIVGANFLIGAATVGESILLGYCWYMNQQKAKNSERLTIVTNSGITHSVVFENKEFLKKVIAAITEIVRELRHRGKTIFNIKDNVIYGSAIGEKAKRLGGFDCIKKTTGMAGGYDFNTTFKFKNWK